MRRKLATVGKDPVCFRPRNTLALALEGRLRLFLLGAATKPAPELVSIKLLCIRAQAEAGLRSRQIWKGPETICDLGAGVPNDIELQPSRGGPHRLGRAPEASGMTVYLGNQAGAAVWMVCSWHEARAS
jgi:hypothetical protein